MGTPKNLDLVFTISHSFSFLDINKLPPKKFGSGNIGATNVVRKSGKKLGLITLIIDFLKGFICCAGSVNGLGILDLKSDYEYMLVGSAVILGHIFSPWLKFKGGKGVATAFGVIIAIL